MVNEKTSSLINEIGLEMVAESQPGARSTVLLFGQFGGGAAFGTDLYADHQTYVSWIDADSALTHFAMDLWYLEPPGKKWDVFDCAVENGHLQARFLYSDELRPGEDGLDALKRLAAERFGNREIRYPPLRPSRAGASFKL